MANTKYFTVTVPSTEVPSDQTDVPVYLDLSVLAASHGFFTNARSDAGDVRIYNVTGTKTEVPREIVDYDAVAETGEIHFLADSLLSATDNVFQVEYGDGTLTDYLVTDTFGRNAVWANYLMVMHMNQDPSGTAPQIINSTGGANGTSQGTMLTADLVEGKIGSAIDFDGVDDRIIFGTIHGGLTNYTISAWVKALDSTAFGGIAGRWRANAGYSMTQWNNGSHGGLHNAAPYDGIDSPSPIPELSFSKAKITYNGVDRIHYVQGSQVADDTKAALSTASGNWEIGAYGNGQSFFGGAIDEVRLSNDVHSADREAIEYANQNDPATFYTLSAEQDIGGGGGTTYDESFSIGQSNELSPMGNIIVDDAIEIGQQSGILEESTLEGIASFALSNQNIISLASQLLAEGAVQINQVSSVTVNGGLTVEDSFTLALQNAMSFEATEAVVVSFSLGSQSSVTTESQLDAQGSIDLAQASGLTLLDQLDASGTFVLNMQVAIGLLANAIVEAGLSISSLSEITVTGQSITSNVTLPDGRTLKIKLENRTLTIEKDNRTLDIS